MEIIKNPKTKPITKDGKEFKLGMSLYRQSYKGNLLQLQTNSNEHELVYRKTHRGKFWVLRPKNMFFDADTGLDDNYGIDIGICFLSPIDFWDYEIQEKHKSLETNLYHTNCIKNEIKELMIKRENSHH